MTLSCKELVRNQENLSGSAVCKHSARPCRDPSSCDNAIGRFAILMNQQVNIVSTKVASRCIFSFSNICLTLGCRHVQGWVSNRWGGKIQDYTDPECRGHSDRQGTDGLLVSPLVSLSLLENPVIFTWRYRQQHTCMTGD